MLALSKARLTRVRSSLLPGVCWSLVRALCGILWQSAVGSGGSACESWAVMSIHAQPAGHSLWTDRRTTTPPGVSACVEQQQSASSSSVLTSMASRGGTSERKAQK